MAPPFWKDSVWRRGRPYAGEHARWRSLGARPLRGLGHARFARWVQKRAPKAPFSLFAVAPSAAVRPRVLPASEASVLPASEASVLPAKRAPSERAPPAKRSTALLRPQRLNGV